MRTTSIGGPEIRAILIKNPSLIINTVPLLGLSYIAASLEELGCQLRLIDSSAPANRLNNKEIINQIKQFSPHLIGICLYTLEVKLAYKLARDIKQNFNCILIAGGPHATMCPEEALRNYFDIVVKGEGDYTVRDIISFINKKRKLQEIKGISFIDGDRIIHNLPRPRIQNLDYLPFPARHLFQPEWYMRDGRIPRVFYGVLLGSRGCPERCTFCCNCYKELTFRSPENVYDEMKLLNRDYGIEHFVFVDSIFTLNKSRVLTLCNLIKSNERFNPKWDISTKVDYVDKKLLFKMKEAGCESICFGIESGDDDMLKTIKKNVTLKDVERAIDWSNEAGIECSATFMYGFPEETEAQIYKTLDFIRKLSPMLSNLHSYGGVIPYPGTEIYEKNKNKYGFENWWLKEKFNQQNLSLPFYRDQKIITLVLDDSVLTKDFYKYDTKIKKAIVKANFYIIKSILKINLGMGIIKRHVLIFFIFSSFYLYKISPSLEKLIVRNIYLIFRKIYRFMKKILKKLK